MSDKWHVVKHSRQMELKRPACCIQKIIMRALNTSKKKVGEETGGNQAPDIKGPYMPS